MCLTTEAFALFLNLIGASIVTADTDLVTVHATEGDVKWVAQGNTWCTDVAGAPRVFTADEG